MSESSYNNVEPVSIVKKHTVSLTATVLVLLLTFSATFYIVSRAVFVIYAQYPFLDKLLAVVFMLCELFVMFHGVAFCMGILRIRNSATRNKPETEPVFPESFTAEDTPSVAVLVPSRHEPKEVLEKTFTCLYNLDYPNLKVYLLDDSSDESYKADADKIAEKYGAQVFRREERHGAKAGIINDCVKKISAEYVAVFDADQNPIPSFFTKLIPVLQEDPKLAFVQTPQFYSNLNNSRVAFAANLQQAVFYEYICEAKSSDESMMCCGTNVIFRREALLDVGGLDELTVTEDFATSIAFLENGWKTRYVDHVYAFGMGPEDLGSYLSQQNRWAMGNVTVLKRIFQDLRLTPHALTGMQWFDFITTGSYYFVGWAYLFLMLCPVMFVLFNIPSFFMDPAIYILTFAPYLILSYFVFYVTMAGRNYKTSDLFKGQLLMFISLPTYAKAAVSGLIGRKSSFQITTKDGSHNVLYRSLWPQLLFWTINLASLTWGVNRLIYDPSGALIINVFWILFHFLLLSSIFYFNEQEA